MDKYSIEIVAKAEKEFLKLPETAKKRVREKILLLENNPRPFGSKKLRGTEYYRIRIGDFRVIYSIHDNNKIVKILSVAHRKDVYK
jgi:mRNA interferase RelE/StbE